MTFNLMFNPPADILAMRERERERDLACYALLGSVRAIVDGATYRSVLGDEYRLQQLARALARTEARMAEADAKCDAEVAAYRAAQAAEVLTNPENDISDI